MEQNLIWPAPSARAVASFAIKDYPRFFVPEWGPTPPPAQALARMEPQLLATNGYDFTNDVDGDCYIFLLDASGNTTAAVTTTESPAALLGWHAARLAFTALTGPTPLLPDYAYGTWFTWWHPTTSRRRRARSSAGATINCRSTYGPW